MTVYKVELIKSFGRSSNIVKTYYFNNKRDAKDFIEEGNQILTNSRAYNYSIYGPEWIDINSVKDVKEELNQLKQDFEDYRY